MRFREEELSFKVSDTADEAKRKNQQTYSYPGMIKKQGNFTLTVQAGSFNDSEILVMLGENGTGKTTLIRLLAGITKPEGFLDDDDQDVPQFNVSYKPQKIAPKFESTVRHLLQGKIREAYLHPQFNSDVMKPLRIEELMDQEVQNLSGGELQRVAITLCLGKPADLYLIDEPSAYLDSEQRIVAAKVIKRFIMHSKKTAFIVEHDFIMSAYLADRVIVYSVRLQPLWCNWPVLRQCDVELPARTSRTVGPSYWCASGHLCALRQQLEAGGVHAAVVLRIPQSPMSPDLAWRAHVAANDTLQLALAPSYISCRSS